MPLCALAKASLYQFRADWSVIHDRQFKKNASALSAEAFRHFLPCCRPLLNSMCSCPTREDAEWLLFCEKVRHGLIERRLHHHMIASDSDDTL